jgi:hypothetical protein
MLFKHTDDDRWAGVRVEYAPSLYGHLSNDNLET